MGSHSRRACSVQSSIRFLLFVALAVLAFSSLFAARGGSALDGMPRAQAQEETVAQLAAPVSVATDFVLDDFYVRVPGAARSPATVLVALHGMGASGEDFVRPLLEQSDQLGWVVVAPTFDYGNWHDPADITRDEATNIPRLASMLDKLPELTGLPVHREVLVYGYSRGAQAANRFALVFPQRVLRVAALAAGTYTLPAHEEKGAAIRFPFGVADMPDLFGRTFDLEAFRRVPFWVGVGQRDSDPSAVPHQWDRFLGDDRLERAGRFAQRLQGTGVPVELQVFPDAGHGETQEMRAAAVDFLSGHRPVL